MFDSQIDGDLSPVHDWFVRVVEDTDTTSRSVWVGHSQLTVAMAGLHCKEFRRVIVVDDIARWNNICFLLSKYTITTFEIYFNFGSAWRHRYCVYNFFFGNHCFSSILHKNAHFLSKYTFRMLGFCFFKFIKSPVDWDILAFGAFCITLHFH